MTGAAAHKILVAVVEEHGVVAALLIAVIVAAALSIVVIVAAALNVSIATALWTVVIVAAAFAHQTTTTIKKIRHQKALTRMFPTPNTMLLILFEITTATKMLLVIRWTLMLAKALATTQLTRNHFAVKQRNMKKKHSNMEVKQNTTKTLTTNNY